MLMILYFNDHRVTNMLINNYKTKIVFSKSNPSTFQHDCVDVITVFKLFLKFKNTKYVLLCNLLSLFFAISY